MLGKAAMKVGRWSFSSLHLTGGQGRQEMPFSKYVFLAPFTERGGSTLPSLFKGISKTISAPKSTEWSLAVKGDFPHKIGASQREAQLAVPLEPHIASSLTLHKQHHWVPGEDANHEDDPKCPRISP